jgi:hypothetical protein
LVSLIPSLSLSVSFSFSADSTKGGRDQPSRYSEIPSWFQLEHLSQGFVRIFGEDIRSYTDDPERVSALHRVADVRIYRDVLSPDEIRKLHEESHWPEGGKMRQVQASTPQKVCTSLLLSRYPQCNSLVFLLFFQSHVACFFDLSHLNWLILLLLLCKKWSSTLVRISICSNFNFWVLDFWSFCS